MEGRSAKEGRSGARTTERKQEIVLEMTWPPTNPILLWSLVNCPRGNSSRELVGKFDFAVMTIPGMGCRYGETLAIKLASIRSGMLSHRVEFVRTLFNGQTVAKLVNFTNFIFIVWLSGDICYFLFILKRVNGCLWITLFFRLPYS